LAYTLSYSRISLRMIPPIPEMNCLRLSAEAETNCSRFSAEAAEA